MKYVKGLSIEGYRGFRTKEDITLAVPSGEPTSGLTILTGPNHAGKTSVLESIRFLGFKPTT